MADTTMTMLREVYDDSGELINEVEVHINVVFLEEQRQTWDSPGSPGEISIGDCIDDDGNRVELTPCEEEYVYNNLHKHLRELKEDAEYESYEAQRKER